MGRIGVLVVEDSVTVRERLGEAIASDPGLELVGMAPDGRAAIEICAARRPDVVTMDMAMPDVGGLEATRHIMAWCPTPILIVSSSFNRGELFQTYDALAAGAVDVLEKPTGEEADGVWERRYLAAVRLVARIRVITHLSGRSARPRPGDAAPAALPRGSRPRTSVAAIGASTGGPAAIVAVMRAMRPDVAVPVLLVLHVGARHAGAFAEWLADQTGWPAAFATDGARLAAHAGEIVIAPPACHMVVDQGAIRLSDAPERNFCRPSIDVLFESLAEACGHSTIAALLTGMGRDGAAGLHALRQAGGLTIAQDEATSVVYGMPREAARLGAAVQILPLGEIGAAMGREVLRGRPT